MSAKIRYYIYLALLYPIALLPWRVLYVISDILYFIFGKIIHYRHDVVRKNLETSFPEKSPEEIDKIQKGFYRHFCDIIVETIKLLHVSDASLKRHIKVTGFEEVDRCAETGQPVILFIGHLGNWELVLTATLYYSKKFQSCHIYKPLRDKAADRLMIKVRGRFDSIGIPQASTVRTLLGMRDPSRPFLAGFIADQRSNSEVAHQRMDFLNHITPYNVGGETIGNKLGARFFYLDISQPRRGYYDMHIVPMNPDPDDTAPNPYTRQYMKLLEENIRRQPHLWLWSHRRWLYK